MTTLPAASTQLPPQTAALPQIDAGRLAGQSDDQLRETAERFEAVFLAQMLKPMMESLSTDGPFGGGHGEETVRSLLIEEYGSQIAAAGGVGLADAVHAELLRQQEGA